MRPVERQNPRFTCHLHSRALTINFFRLCWIVLIIWGDLGVYYWSLSTCRWPELSSTEKATHVLLVSDPQVQHPKKDDGRMSFISQLRRFMFDLNLRKNWHVTTRMRPHIVIFLGDMLASGKNVQDEIEYQKHAEKFKSIFSLDPYIPVYYIPGNNDVGMGVLLSSFKAIRSQYTNHFGPLNQQIVVRNHTFLLIDAPGLVDEDYQRAGQGIGFDNWIPLQGGTADFVKSVERDIKPLILLSHIPLARPDSASCGPLREKGTILRGVGHGYQNTLGKQTTAFLLRALQPAAVYSGDDRDYCEYTHIAKKAKTGHTGADVREVTVKSFSMAKHIRHPGFQLISLIDPNTDPNQKSFLDTPCSLPNQYGIYSRVYFPLFILTMFALLILSLLRRRSGRTSQFEPLKLSPHSSGTNTPEAPPESAMWSPHTPSVPCSLRSMLPSSLRTPTTLAYPTFRVSKPTTPVGSLLPPMHYSHDVDEEEAMYPPQYVSSQEGCRRLEDEDFSHGHRRISSETLVPHFTSAPSLRPTPRRGGPYPWRSTSRGRRRRISFPTFSLELLKDVGGLLKGGMRTPRGHRILKTTLRDGVDIFSVVVLFWVLLSWRWMF